MHMVSDTVLEALVQRCSRNETNTRVGNIYIYVCVQLMIYRM